MQDTVHQYPWTYTRMIKELKGDARYELRNNELIEMSSPSEIHQQLVFRLTLLVGEFIQMLGLGKLYPFPFDVILDENNVVQPDLLFVANDHADLIQERGVFGSPDLVIEIVSKSSIIRDYVEKKEDYERFGIREYWIIDPQNKFIQVFQLQGNKFKTFSSADGEEQLKAVSSVLPGFEIVWNDLFASSK